MIQVIAEIGWNHLGDLSLAEQMISAAAKNGATYAKFQTWSVSRLKPGAWDNDGRRSLYEKAELSPEHHLQLIKCCEDNGILFLSSVFSVEDAILLKKLGCRAVKIPSFESRNADLLSFCNNNFDTVYLSTGTSTLEEIKSSISLLDRTRLFLLHCISVYPCSYAIANLPKMIQLQRVHNLVGYSDHIEGVESAKVAIGFGAVVIEKHFTIDKSLPGRDNQFAILPFELRDLTEFIRNREMMMIDHGTGFLDLENDSRLNYAGRFNNG